MKENEYIAKRRNYLKLRSEIMECARRFIIDSLCELGGKLRISESPAYEKYVATCGGVDVLFYEKYDNYVYEKVQSIQITGAGKDINFVAESEYGTIYGSHLQTYDLIVIADYVHWYLKKGQKLEKELEDEEREEMEDIREMYTEEESYE